MHRPDWHLDVFSKRYRELAMIVASYVDAILKQENRLETHFRYQHMYKELAKHNRPFHFLLRFLTFWPDASLPDSRHEVAEDSSERKNNEHRDVRHEMDEMKPVYIRLTLFYGRAQAHLEKLLYAMGFKNVSHDHIENLFLVLAHQKGKDLPEICHQRYQMLSEVQHRRLEACLLHPEYVKVLTPMMDTWMQHMREESKVFSQVRCALAPKGGLSVTPVSIKCEV